jgi:hypothetical protein
MSREALDQSAMRISVASKVKPGACLTLPVHDACAKDFRNALRRTMTGAARRQAK